MPIRNIKKILEIVEAHGVIVAGPVFQTKRIIAYGNRQLHLYEVFTLTEPSGNKTVLKYRYNKNEYILLKEYNKADDPGWILKAETIKEFEKRYTEYMQKRKAEKKMKLFEAFAYRSPQVPRYT